jgi:hypothetical protein
MPLIRPRPPRQTKEAYLRGLAAMIQAGRIPTSFGEERQQEIYNLCLRDIAGKAGIKGAKSVQWQFLMSGASGRSVAIDVAHPRRGQLPKMTSLVFGTDVAEFFEETKNIERLPAVKTRRYALRRLRVPGVVSSFWLKASRDEDDLVVPYVTLTKRLKYMHPYPMDEFLRILKPLAQKQAESEDSQPAFR